MKKIKFIIYLSWDNKTFEALLRNKFLSYNIKHKKFHIASAGDPRADFIYLDLRKKELKIKDIITIKTESYFQNITIVKEIQYRIVAFKNNRKEITIFIKEHKGD